MTEVLGKWKEIHISIASYPSYSLNTEVSFCGGGYKYEFFSTKDLSKYPGNEPKKDFHKIYLLVYINNTKYRLY